MAAPTIVFGPQGYTDAGSHVHTLDAAVPADSTVLIFCNSTIPDDDSGFEGVTDEEGHTWACAAFLGETISVPAGFDDGDALCSVEVWYTYSADGIPDATDITTDAHARGQSPTVTIAYIAGQWEPNEANGNAAFTDTPATPNITPDGARYIFGLLGFKNQGEAPIWTAGTGWTELVDFGGPGNTESGTNQAVQYREEASGGTFSSTGTSAGNDTSSNLIVAFEEVEGGGGDVGGSSHMSRMYSASFENVSVTAAQDFFELLPAANKPVAIHAVYLSQSSDVADAAEEILRVLMQRLPATVTGGSGGSSFTPTPLNAHDTAAGATCEVNNTTGASTSGSAVNLHAEQFNIRIGMQWIPTPEMRPVIKNAEAFIVELMAAPADALSMSGTIYFEELV